MLTHVFLINLLIFFFVIVSSNCSTDLQTDNEVMFTGSCYVSKNYRFVLLLVSVQTPMYSTRAFWKKRPIGQVYHEGRNVTSQTPVVSMTTRLI